MKNIFTTKNSIAVFFLTLSFLVSAHGVGAVSPDEVFFEGPSAVAMDATLSVDVLINTTKPINAIDMEVSYPKDKLQFVSSNNARSIIDIWEPKPTVLADGNIGLAGGIMKSFNGDEGLIIKLYFKPLSTGQTTLAFVKNYVYMADGKGTRLDVREAPYLFTTKNAVATSPATITPNQGGEPTVDSSLQGPDKTPPVLVLQSVKSPVDGASLIAFQASDPESGIKETYIRIKKWFSWSDWTPAQNPVVRPLDAWQIEIKADNNDNFVTIQSLAFTDEVIKKLFIALFLFFSLVFVIVWVYNNRK